MDFVKKAMGSSNKSSSAGHSGGNKEGGDFATKLFDKASKKAGFDLPPEQDKKITGAARGMFDKFNKK